MNARNKILSILSIMLAMTAVTKTKTHLYNDTCSSILTRKDISARVAKVECHSDSVTFDPSSQNGLYLYNNKMDSWTGEIFVCQCSCHLPNNIPNGQILSESTIPHGEMLEYKCDAGFEKSITRMIVCLDGLLLIISNYSEYSHSQTAFRQISLPETFAEDFQEYIFQLELNATADWSIPESEVRYNQKVYGIHANQTQLLYYLHNGNGYQDGRVDLKRHQKVECVKKMKKRTITVPPEAFESDRIPTCIIVIMVIVGLVYLIAAIDGVVSRIKKKLWPVSELGTNDEKENLNCMQESGEENNIPEISEFDERHRMG